MIKANELRLGNWVKLNSSADDKDFCIVDSITASDPDKCIGLAGNLILNYPAQILPIPLTPEILEKCGFEIDGFTHYSKELPCTYGSAIKRIYFAGDYLYLEELPRDKGVANIVVLLNVADVIVLWNKDLMKTFYLHQLQNLYFALTGDELKINL